MATTKTIDISAFTLSSSGSTTWKSHAISLTVPSGQQLSSVKLTVTTKNAQGSSYLNTSKSTTSPLKKWSTGTVTVTLPNQTSQTVYFGFDAATGTGSQTRTYQSITVTYVYDTIASACSAPVEFKTSASGCTADSNITLSWSGAFGGTNNDISGYLLTCKVSADGSTWGSDWKTVKNASGTAIGDIASTATSGTLTFKPADAIRQYSSMASTASVDGYYIKFAIQTKCVDTDYYSTVLYGSFVVNVSAAFVQQPVYITPKYKSVNIWRRVK